jgi:predicted transcriptional regulator
MVRRDRHDITVEILNQAKSRKKKTEIISKVGLSFSQTRKYFKMLQDEGLLKMDERHNYSTTPKGEEFLEKCQKCFLFSWEKKKQ